MTAALPGWIEETRAFFAPRAATWDERFPDDGPAFEAAVAELDLAAGEVVADVGCGTGRALEPLRRAVGPAGAVLAVDVTPEMLAETVGRGRAGPGTGVAAVLADAGRLPVGGGHLDAVFAAGLLTHPPDPLALLAELARATRGGGRLVLFHPVGRATLARRHGHDLDPDDIRAFPAVAGALARSGWAFQRMDDTPDRYLVRAVRT